MRIAVLSDTHLPRGGRTLPKRCLAELAAADLVLHAGDFVRSSVLDDLRGLGPPLEAVHGNMDDERLRAALPDRRVVESAGARIGMVHDPGPRAGREDRLLTAFPGCQAVVYGHTHIPHVGRHRGVWILNPGSPTERRRGPVHSLIVLDVEGRTIEPNLVELP